jgi:cell division protein FtsQ
MTALQKTSRASFVRQRRSPKSLPTPAPKRTNQNARRMYHSTSVYLPIEPRPVARRDDRQIQGKSSASRATKNNQRNGYEIAFSLGGASVRAPVLAIPQLGPRWVSAALTLVLTFMLFTLWTASPFTVTTATVRGNQRLGVAEINAMLSLIGQPIFKAVPDQIVTDLHTAFSDLESIKVRVTFPNRILVDVVERTPVLAWYQNGVLTWIDPSGVAFLPRGEDPGLVLVAANGSPTRIPLDAELPIYEQKFISPEMVQAMTVLARDVPAGMPMTFDPVYGMGWQDPRGWSVYFGQDSRDISMKKVVYQAIVDTLNVQGVQPTLISVEYLNAPFYK